MNVGGSHFPTPIRQLRGAPAVTGKRCEAMSPEPRLKRLSLLMIMAPII